MKKIISALLCVATVLLLGACGSEAPAQIAATTLPVYEFTQALCQDTPLSVIRLVTEDVSCLHDYSLNVRQVKAAEAAEVIVISGAGLEDHLQDVLLKDKQIDASAGIELICPEQDGHDHKHDHDHSHDHGHVHEQDPHIWLDPRNAMTMANNICAGLSLRYPQYAGTFEQNLQTLLLQLQELEAYGQEQLQELSCRELITFHDGFSYFAQAFGLTVLMAVEEESGSEASAGDLMELIEAVEHHRIPAIFTEANGSISAAQVIARETGAGIYTLDMAMASDSYFTAMYHNIDTVREALG